MTDQSQSSGDLSPGTAPALAPQSTPQPTSFEARRAAQQEKLHTPPPRQRQPQAPNPNAARDAPPGVGKNFGDASTPEGRRAIAVEARREALAADAPPTVRLRAIPAPFPIEGRATPRKNTNWATISS